MDVSAIEPPFEDVHASTSSDHVETTPDPISVHTEDQPPEPIAAPVIEIETEHVDEVPATSAGDGNVVSSENILPTDQVEVIAPPQEDQSAILDEHTTSEQMTDPETHVSAAVIEEPTLDASAMGAEDSEKLQAHAEVVRSGDFGDKLEDEVKSEEPAAEYVLEQTASAAVDEAAGRSVGVGEGDPVLPPGLYPTAAAAESHSGTPLASVDEGLSSVSVIIDAQRG